VIPDALGNLIPLDPSQPSVDNQGDVIGSDGSITPAVSLLLPSVPWWVYAGLAVVAFIVIKDVVR
jgi:hypothetical protein